MIYLNVSFRIGNIFFWFATYSITHAYSKAVDIGVAIKTIAVKEDELMPALHYLKLIRSRYMDL